VGDVVNLTGRREARSARLSAAAERAELHPALRWVAGTAYWVAHRRHPEQGTAACGAGGDLVLAPPGVPLCELCYPGSARPTA
jgi:hypothetical protein